MLLVFDDGRVVQCTEKNFRIYLWTYPDKIVDIIVGERIKRPRGRPRKW